MHRWWLGSSCLSCGYSLQLFMAVPLALRFCLHPINLISACLGSLSLCQPVGPLGRTTCLPSTAQDRRALGLAPDSLVCRVTLAQGICVLCKATPTAGPWACEGMTLCLCFFI